jgi:PKD repeat protein
MYPQFLLADFSSDVITGSSPLTVNFTNETTGWPDETAPIISHEWTFGDGTISSENNPSNIYTVPGTYSVTLTETRNFISDTITKTAFIVVTDSVLNADFTGSPRAGYLTLPVQFVDQSTGSPTTWYWDFGDGGFSTDQNPSHQYTSPGWYTVALTAANSLRSDSEVKVKYILMYGTATPDIAPEPDILLYMRGQIEAYYNGTGSGLRMAFRKKL